MLSGGANDAHHGDGGPCTDHKCCNEDDLQLFSEDKSVAPLGWPLLQ